MNSHEPTEAEREAERDARDFEESAYDDDDADEPCGASDDDAG